MIPVKHAYKDATRGVASQFTVKINFLLTKRHCNLFKHCKFDSHICDK